MTDIQPATLALGDKTLAYFSVGEGPPVVIIHGVGGHKEDWTGVALALADTHQVFAFDMLGFGGSSKTGNDLSMPVQAGAIAAVSNVGATRSSSPRMGERS